jgi:hypothetical protein
MAPRLPPNQRDFVVNPTELSQCSATRKRELQIEVEERVTDEEATPFSVNRLISCPNLTPSISRSETPHLHYTTAFINVTDVAFVDPALVNWAEHSPITPR